MGTVIVRLSLLISGMCAALVLLAVLLRLPSPVIVYVRDVDTLHHLYQIDLRTNITHALTDSGSRNISPAWSPDGESIAFVSNRDDGFGIYLMDTDGDNVRQLIDPEQGDVLSPAWSPSGDRLAYNNNRPEGRFFIDIYNLDDDTIQRRVSISMITGNPQWSPDARQILFTTLQRSNILLSRQWLDQDRSTETLTVALGQHQVRFISIHPAGEQVALSIFRDAQVDLYLLDLPNLTLRQLTDDPGQDEWVQWSPNGARLVFTRTSATGTDLHLMTMETGEIQPLTTGDGLYTAPSWSPDGETIAFVGLRDNRWSLWLVDVTSGAISRTATANVVASRPQWRPR